VPSTRRGKSRDYAFADLALALRQRAGLTQGELAALLGVSKRAMVAWEVGESYPVAERLKQLIAFYLERGVLQAGREEEEAATLWTSVHGAAARRTAPFDPGWFASQRRAVEGMAPVATTSPTDPARWDDWGRRLLCRYCRGAPRSWPRWPDGCARSAAGWWWC
jgi:DNA-binding XRE family transcriptional regulator